MERVSSCAPRASFDVYTDGKTSAEAAHDGYRRLSHPVIHRRTLDLNNHELVIHDRIEGTGYHNIEEFFHFHPDVKPNTRLDEKLVQTIEASSWHPEFNTGVRNETVIGTWAGQCPVQFTTILPFVEGL